jgi:DNA-binding response OmpR family regulator
MRILLAEDDPSIAAVTLEVLVGEGYDVTHAAAQGEARRLAQAESWDLFLVDMFGASYERPGPEDLAFLRELVTHGPVIVVTARLWAARVSASDLGVAAVLAKPYDVDGLLSLIRSVTGR